jgi:hypothetical protein
MDFKKNEIRSLDFVFCTMTTNANPLQKPVNKIIDSDVMPIYLWCILDDLSDYNDPNIHAIRDYAISMKIIFKTRVYDSSKYSDDRNIIERLPAYHIHIKRNRFRTFYPNTRPYQHIQETIAEYQRRIEQKIKRKNRLWRLYTAFLELFRRKTKMEQVAEDKKKQKQTRLAEWA